MNKFRILVVEDHKPLLAGIRDILEAVGYTVLTATNGKKALQTMEQEQTNPDLVVADIMMPALDGYALYHKIRDHPEWQSIPVVFLTSKAEQDDILKGKKLGVDGYITKPFDPSDFLAMVKTLLTRIDDD